MHTQTEKLAERLLADQANQSWNDAKLVQHAFQLCLARPATEHETDQAFATPARRILAKHSKRGLAIAGPRAYSLE